MQDLENIQFNLFSYFEFFLIFVLLEHQALWEDYRLLKGRKFSPKEFPYFEYLFLDFRGVIPQVFPAHFLTPFIFVE